jgi:acyl carrier protein
LFLMVEVSDRFGDYGKSGLLVIDRTARLWTVACFALSCRVLGRDVEFRILELLTGQALAAGVSGVAFQFQQTVRNVPAQRFLQELGKLAELGPAEGGSFVFPLDRIGAALQRRQATGQPPAIVPDVDQPDRSPVALAGEVDFRAARRRFYRLVALEYRSAAAIEHDLAVTAPRKRVAAGIYEAPRTAVEQMLASLWAELLKLERVGVHDNFFELGGHSLLATRLVARIRDGLGVELPLRTLFEAPMLKSLAAQIEAAQSAAVMIQYDEVNLIDEITSMTEEEAERLLGSLGEDRP